MPGIGIILNPHSRSNLKNPTRARRLGFIVGDKGSCHETKDPADVERLAREFCDREIEILGISGGDGTIHMTLSSFIKAYGGTPLPKIAFLRGGTMNNVATVLGIRGTPENVLSRLILKYHQDDPFRTAELNTLKINGSYGFVFGLGVVERFIEHYERTNVKPTPTRAAMLLAYYMSSALVNGKAACRLCRRFDATITVDGERLPFKNYTMLFAGTIETLGLGFNPMGRARELVNQFQIAGVSATPRQLIKIFPKAYLEQPIGREYIEDRVGSLAVLEFAEPQMYTLDGDFPEGPTTRVEISMGPRMTCLLL